jgi:hypothetical protein
MDNDVGEIQGQYQHISTIVNSDRLDGFVATEHGLPTQNDTATSPVMKQPSK